MKLFDITFSCFIVNIKGQIREIFFTRKLNGHRASLMKNWLLCFCMIITKVMNEVIKYPMVPLKVFPISSAV